MIFKHLFLIVFLSVSSVVAVGQTVKRDSLTANNLSAVADTAKVKIIVKDTAFHNPRIATKRSALIPGWGQAYNKEYWKIPLVYAAIGVPAGFFIYNNTWYKKTKKAYAIRLDNDTARFGEIDKQLYYSNGGLLTADDLRFYRNDFRKNRDYSILYFLLAWGLNVADATVFAHLKQFDVSPDLSMQVTPTFNAGTKSTGLSLVMAVKNPSKPRQLQSR